jgi:hypothetical protein
MRQVATIAILSLAAIVTSASAQDALQSHLNGRLVNPRAFRSQALPQGVASARTPEGKDVSCAAAPYFGIVNGPLVVDGNLVVPNGGSCTVGSAVNVIGNVKVGQNAGFIFYGNLSTIFGNFEADNCAYVDIIGNGFVVGGDLKIQNCTGSGNPYSGFAFVEFSYFNEPTGNTIIGNVRCEGNSAACFLSYSSIGGDAQVNNNISPGTPSVIGGNNIDGSLRCIDNSPTPTNDGVGNTVLGNKDPNSGRREDHSDQCQGL